MMENINVSTPNDGLGDPLRNAFVKVNLNFTELDNGKEVKLLASDSTKYYRGDKSWQTLDKTAVGLNLVDNTADSNKPVSIPQQNALNAKEPAITSGTTSQYWRGDKTWQSFPAQETVDQTIIDGSTNAVSGNAVLDALATKAPLAHTHTVSQITDFPTFKTIENLSIIGAGNIDLDKASVGLGNVDNTSDLNKSISTATQTALDDLQLNKENKANKNIANGYAGLDSSGKIIPTQLPALVITDTFVVNSQAAMLALVAEVGDVAVRTDLNKSFILRVTGASTLANWQELLSPTSVDQTIIDGSTNAVSSNAVFDGLATKAPISSVHNPVTLGTANGLSLSNQQLSLGLASSGVTGALSGTDWNTFNGKFPTPTGLTINYIPKWNGSGFGNSLIYDSGTNVGIGTTTPTEKLDVVGACRFVTAYLDLADGTTNYYVAKPLGSIGDFATSVILLHPVYSGTIITHYECNGTITVRRGGSYAGLNTGSISINSSTAYNNNIYNVSYINTDSNIYKLVTCDFGGVKYLALRADLSAEAQAKSFFFDGYSQGDSNTLQIKAIGAVTNVVVVSSNGKRELEGLTVSGNITASPAILSNHVVVKSQLDALVSSGTYTPSNQTNPAQTVNFIRSYWERKGNVLTVTTSLTYTVTQIQSSSSFSITLPNGFLVSGANDRIIGSSLLHTTQGIFNNNANMKAYETSDSSQINLQANFQATVSSGTYDTTIIYTVLIQ